MDSTMEAGVESAGAARQLLGPVLRIEEGRIRQHRDGFVRPTAGEMLNVLPDAEADHLFGAPKYEYTEGRKDISTGSYDRQLRTKADRDTLTVPKLRNLPFETAFIERHRRIESSVKEALIEMYLASVSLRRVEDITQALWGTRVSENTLSDLDQKIYEWCEGLLVGEFAYVFVDGLMLKRHWIGEKNASMLVVIGVAQSGYREILAVSEGAKEGTASWANFPREVKQCGLKGVELFVSDKCLGLVESLAHFYPEARWQRRVMHFYSSEWTVVPVGKVKELAAMLKATHAQEDAQAAKEKLAVPWSSCAPCGCVTRWRPLRTAPTRPSVITPA